VRERDLRSPARVSRRASAVGGWRRFAATSAVRTLVSWVWALSPLTAVFGPVPTFAVIAVWKRSRRYAALTAGCAVATATAYVLYRTLPPDDQDPVPAIMFPLTMGALIHALRIRRKMFALPKADKRPQLAPADDVPVRPPRRRQPVMTRALEARELRHEARELLTTDPALATELGIGRPELHRGFDDGGLVDVNHASAEAIGAILGLEGEHIAQIIQVREELGGFSSLADLVVHTDIPPGLVDRLAERLIFVADL
jgi:hypothetical protein